jgi:exodeoxyribonuclease VII small subunit
VSFEQNLARLEEIVAELQGDGMDLDRALALFEQGVAELRAATNDLARAETSLKRLVEHVDGSMEVVDLRA